MRWLTNWPSGYSQHTNARFSRLYCDSPPHIGYKFLIAAYLQPTSIPYNTTPHRHSALHPAASCTSQTHAYHPPSTPEHTHLPSAKMVKQNDVIAIIIIILFFVLALIAFGIYRLVSIARGSVASSSGSGSSRSLVDD